MADCWLAAENLLLAAYAQGLGTCVIGFAVSALNTPEWKAELKIPAEMTAVAPMIVGVPAGVTPPVPPQTAGNYLVDLTTMRRQAGKILTLISACLPD